MLVYEQIRCPKCNKRLCDLNGQAQIKCPKCKSLIEVDTDERKIYIRERHEKSVDYPEVG